MKSNKLTADNDQRQLAQQLNNIESKLVAFEPFWKQKIQSIKYEAKLIDCQKEAKKQEKRLKFFSFLSTANEEESEADDFRPKIKKPDQLGYHVSSTPFNQTNVPRGIYTYGSSGTGKTLITAKFFDQLPVEHKLKSHFFEFMDRVHRSNYEQTKVH